MKKIILTLIVALSLPLLMGFNNYNYSFYGEVISSTPGMIYSTYYDSRAIGTNLGSPSDLYVYEDHVYVVDSQLNHILVLDSTFSNLEIHAEFEYSDSFLERETEIRNMVEDEELVEQILSKKLNRPMGIDIRETGIYIADSRNWRVLHLNFDYEIIGVFFEEETILENVSFEPQKITVDTSGRVYAVVPGVYEGIIELDSSGSFNRFVGTTKISLTPFEILRRALMTEAQKETLNLELSTTFTNVNVNERGFIYATANPTRNNYENMIQLINPKGVDVLKRNGYHAPMGDINFIPAANNYTSKVGPSSLVDVAYTDNGIYTVLDQKRARLFTYDDEGNLLYINGESAQSGLTENDKLSTPIAIDYLGDQMLVLDADQRSKKIVVFSLTEFGSKVNEAIKLHSNGMFEEAAVIWEEVLLLNTNYEIAYNGIGKSQLRQKKYREAMRNFKLGHDSFYYSKAFKGYRNELIRKYFSVAALTIIGVAVAVPTIKHFYKKKKGEVSGDGND